MSRDCNCCTSGISPLLPTARRTPALLPLHGRRDGRRNTLAAREARIALASHTLVEYGNFSLCPFEQARRPDRDLQTPWKKQSRRLPVLDTHGSRNVATYHGIVMSRHKFPGRGRPRNKLDRPSRVPDRLCPAAHRIATRTHSQACQARRMTSAHSRGPQARRPSFLISCRAGRDARADERGLDDSPNPVSLRQAHSAPSNHRPVILLLPPTGDSLEEQFQCSPARSDGTGSRAELLCSNHPDKARRAGTRSGIMAGLPRQGCRPLTNTHTALCGPANHRPTKIAHERGAALSKRQFEVRLVMPDANHAHFSGPIALRTVTPRHSSRHEGIGARMPA